jgi:hypothetical protein
MRTMLAAAATLASTTSEADNTMASYQIPPWLESANPAAYSAKGYGLGIQAGAEEAANRFKQQQIALQQQKAAQDEAQMQAEMGLKQQAEQDKRQQFASDLALQQQHQDLLAQTAAQKSQAILAYQQAIQGGMDPTDAILQYGPAMGQQASPEAAALREVNKQPAAWVPPDLETGAPGHFKLPGGGVHIPPGVKPPADPPEWVPENKDTGEPAHWQTATGQVHLPGKSMEGSLSQDDRESLRADRKILTDTLKATSGIDGRLFQHTDPEGYKAALAEAQSAADAILEIKPGDPQALAIKKLAAGGQSGTSSKVQMAQKLHEQHPDWTKAQIIDAVNAGGQ